MSDDFYCCVHDWHGDDPCPWCWPDVPRGAWAEYERQCEQDMEVEYEQSLLAGVLADDPSYMEHL